MSLLRDGTGDTLTFASEINSSQTSAEQQATSCVEKDAFGDEEGPGIHYKTCTWWQVGILMIAENISLGVLALPQALASLGLVPGLFCIFFLGVIATYTGWLIGEFKLAHPSIQSYSDCGYILFGRVGRVLFAVGQVLVLIFIMGAHILSFAIALNVITDHASCTLVLSFTGLIISFLLGLPRRFRHVSYFSIFSCISVVVSVLIAMVAIGIEKPDVRHVVAVRYGNSLVKSLSPIMNIVLAYNGHVTFVSLQAELRDPRDFKRALFLEQTVAVIFYMLVSFVIYYFAGPLVASPALGSAPYLVRKICFGLGLATIIIGGVVNGSVVCKYIYVSLWAGTDVIHESSWRSVGSWWVICIACWTGSWILAEAIPNFNLFLGLIAALFGSWFSFAIPPMLYIHQHKERLFSSKRRTTMTLFALFVCLLGISIFGLGIWSSGWELRHGSAGRVFSCENNWHPTNWDREKGKKTL